MAEQHSDPAPQQLQLAVQGTPMGVRHGLMEVIDWMEQRHLSETHLSITQLVLAEVLNNIVEHALAERPQTKFWVMVRHEDDALVFKTIDDGCAMPGKALPLRDMPDVTVETNDLPEGGFGWPIFLTLAQDIQYERLDGQNQLHFAIPCDK